MVKEGMCAAASESDERQTQAVGEKSAVKLEGAGGDSRWAVILGARLSLSAGRNTAAEGVVILAFAVILGGGDSRNAFSLTR